MLYNTIILNAVNKYNSIIIYNSLQIVWKYIDKLIIEGNVKLIVIENKDKLVRFGFEMFEIF